MFSLSLCNHCLREVYIYSFQIVSNFRHAIEDINQTIEEGPGQIKKTRGILITRKCLKNTMFWVKIKSI